LPEVLEAPRRVPGPQRPSRWQAKTYRSA
jgi:hypothetical protein